MPPRSTTKSEDVQTRLRELCPIGIDIFFVNVGGVILDAALARLALRGRVVLCGGFANYNATEPSPGPKNYLNLIVRRGRMEGFLVLDYMPRAAALQKRSAPLATAGCEGGQDQEQGQRATRSRERASDAAAVVRRSQRGQAHPARRGLALLWQIKWIGNDFVRSSASQFVEPTWRVEWGSGAVAEAVRGAARAQGATADVPALCGRADWAGRPQERRANGGAIGALATTTRCTISLRAASGTKAPLQEERAIQADKRIGGPNTVLVVDDTALPKKGTHSVGVAPQYASALGKTANCQTLVSLTLARDEVPVMIGLRLFLPESWTGDADRMWKAQRARRLGERRARSRRSRSPRSTASEPRASALRLCWLTLDTVCPRRSARARCARSGGGRSGSRSCRKSTRATSSSCFRSQDADGPAGVLSLINSPRP